MRARDTTATHNFMPRACDWPHWAMISVLGSDIRLEDPHQTTLYPNVLNEKFLWLNMSEREYGLAVGSSMWRSSKSLKL